MAARFVTRDRKVVIEQAPDVPEAGTVIKLRDGALWRVVVDRPTYEEVAFNLGSQSGIKWMFVVIIEQISMHSDGSPTSMND